jgi:hypothetical protein
MSGGITQLVAVGAQDAHLVGNPEISFFRSAYRRHTNFAQSVERQVLQGTPNPGGISTVRFERKGDLLGYVYLSCKNGASASDIQWSDVISKVELLIGGQVIDTQDYTFSDELAVDLLAPNLSKSALGGHYTGGGIAEWFYPLRFWFCENWQSALPLVALQFHDVEVRITWASGIVGELGGTKTIECYSNFIALDTAEREAISSTKQNILIYQVQKATAAASKIQELNFSHPVRYIAATTGGALTSENSRIKLQINGVDLTDYKFARPHYTTVASYYHIPFATGNGADYFVYPFSLDTCKYQPTGSLNFSRIDSARIISDNENITTTIYAVNTNILRIESGMGGLMYAN